MKPIKLTIEGLNSFEQKQIIDFEKLTRQGFFGIFGPTGSGKSTILDGITLSLYGDEARNSADFINVNVERAFVSFEFQISGAQKRHYLVQREFKRDKNTLKPRSGKCKLVDMTYDPIEVLEENVTAITKRCTEILGLTKDDFTRTVVLPQGKFSEFLKMEGRQRRDMLERLFNLYEYGEQLKNKLSRAMDVKKEAMHHLEGELKGVGAVDQSVLDAQKNLTQQLIREVSERELTLKTLKDQIEEEKTIVSLEDERQQYTTRIREHLAAESQMEDKREALKRYINAQKLEDQVNRYDTLSESIETREVQHNTNRENLVRSENDLSRISQSLEQAKLAFEQERPTHMIRQRQLLEAVETLDTINKKEREGLVISDALKALKSKMDENHSKVALCEQQMEKGQRYVIEVEDQLKQYRISAEVSALVQQGKQIQLEVEKDSKLVTQFVEKGLQLETTLKQLTDQMNQSEQRLKTFEKNCLDLKTQKASLQKNPPGNAQTIATFVQEQYKHQEMWTVYEGTTREIETTQENISACEREMMTRTDKLRVLDQTIEENNLVVETLKKVQMVETLRGTLVESEPCPVCGSQSHPHEGTHESFDESLLADLLIKQKTLQSQKLEMEKAISKWAAQKEILVLQLPVLSEKLEALGTDFKTHTVAELNAKRKVLEEAIAHFETEMSSLEMRIEAEENQRLSQKETHQVLVARLEQTLKQKEELESTLNPMKLSLSQQRVQLETLKTELGVNDFVVHAQQLLEKAQFLEKLEVKHQKALLKMETYRQEKEKAKDTLNQHIQQVTALTSRYESVTAQVSEMRRNLAEKVGPLDLIENEKERLDTTIRNITNTYETLCESYEKVLKTYEMCRVKALKDQQTLEDLKARHEIEKKNIEAALPKLGFETLQTLKAHFKPEAFILSLEESIRLYDETGRELTLMVQNITDKLGGRKVNPLDYEAHLNAYDSCIEEVQKLQEALIGARKTLESYEEKAVLVKQLLIKQTTLSQTLGILKDLESLFKGNKFVEFVAIERLKYISKEASEKLYEITSGAYGLETDDNGRFLIKDNKNGGVLRETSTLSGGETFLASLALALALSAEIQLKGTAPLELFFLDEGFGTLDDQLLDVLMTALERIHHDQLKIGLISHVDAVKNRVPVNLTIVPSGAGEGGSQIVG